MFNERVQAADTPFSFQAGSWEKKTFWLFHISGNIMIMQARQWFAAIHEAFCSRANAMCNYNCGCSVALNQALVSAATDLCPGRAAAEQCLLTIHERAPLVIWISRTAQTDCRVAHVPGAGTAAGSKGHSCAYLVILWHLLLYINIENYPDICTFFITTFNSPPGPLFSFNIKMLELKILSCNAACWIFVKILVRCYNEIKKKLSTCCT